MDWEKEITELLSSQKILVNVAVKLSQTNTSPLELAEILKTVNTLNEVCTKLSSKCSLQEKLTALENNYNKDKQAIDKQLSRIDKINIPEINYTDIINKIKENIETGVTSKAKEDVKLITEKMQAKNNVALDGLAKRINGLENQKNNSSGLEGKLLQIEKKLKTLEQENIDLKKSIPNKLNFNK